jgi:hypothetical protein
MFAIPRLASIHDCVELNFLNEGNLAAEITILKASS